MHRVVCGEATEEESAAVAFLFSDPGAASVFFPLPAAVTTQQ